LQRDTSIDDQIAQCRSKLDANDHIPDHLVFKDQGISGTSMHNRTGLQHLLRACKEENKLFTKLYVADTSRLARNLEELLRICKILKFYGVTLVIASTGMRSDTPGFELGMVFAGYMDEEFVKGIRDKSRRGAIGSLQRGWTPGGRCYGYTNVPILDPTKKGVHGQSFVTGVYQEIHEDEARVVRRIFQTYADGMSYSRIAKQLNKEGVQSPWGPRNGCIRSWSPTGIREMLFNERYLGTIIYGKTTKVKDPDGGTITRKTPPSAWVTYRNENLRIISEELWAAVRAENQRKNQNPSAAKAGGMSRTAASREYLFSGLLKCGLCGANIVITGNTWGEPVYGCAYHRSRGVCSNSLSIQRSRLEKQLLDKIAGSLGSPDFADFLADEFERQLAEAVKAKVNVVREVAERREDSKKELTEVNSEAFNLGKAIAKGGESTTLTALLAQAEKRMATINALLKPTPVTEVPLPTRAQVKEFLDRRMADLVGLLTNDRERAKRELAKRIDKLTLTPSTQNDRAVFLVTGDLRLFTEEDVMPLTSGVGSEGHCKVARISFDNFVLDPKRLPKAA